MSIYRKLVSVLLVALIPTASSLTLVACPQGMAEMAIPQSEMAVMEMASVQMSIAVTPSNLCCQVSPVEIAPGPVRASVGGDTSAVLISTATSVGTLRPAKASGVSDHFPRSSSPPQALLCVFLI